MNTCMPKAAVISAISANSAIAACLLTAALAFPSASAPRAYEASPDAYRVLLSNEHVTVIEMTLQPGQKDEWHTHLAETVYFLSAGDLKISLPDGQAIEKSVKAGDVMWNPTWTHRVENIGNTTVRAVIVEDETAERPDGYQGHSHE